VLHTVSIGLLCQSMTISWNALYGKAEQDVRRRFRESVMAAYCRAAEPRIASAAHVP